MAKGLSNPENLEEIRGLLAQLLEEQIGRSLNKVSESVDVELMRVAESLRRTEVRLAEVAQELAGLNRYVEEDHEDLKSHTEHLIDHTVQLGRIKVYGLVALTVVTLLSNVFGPMVRDRFRNSNPNTTVHSTRVGP